MPTQRAESLPETSSVQTATPTAAQITPALLKQHSITAEEYARIEKLMGRTPSLTELGIFSVMWSEHCSYKSSRVHLKRLPTRGTRTEGPGSVVQGPGENAGIIDVGDGWACAFKIESHNHPSYIEPYQGAATGVGGILRDIFTMNARPFAVMDSLRFGPLDEAEPDEALRRKNHQIVSGVVAGIAGYGNCFGVPNLGGETRFEPCYSGNPLVNAFALGLVRKDEIFYAKATGVGNPVIYVGAKTGRDGIHGATMASEEFTEGSEQKRPNVQMGDPFMEKLLLEACLEAMATGAVLGIQDMGAAGLTCSTCEMGARGELGLTIELDKVPQRETSMSSYEVMLSESQERMLLVADKGREGEVLAVFAKWGLDASIVGIVTADDTMRVLHHGELVAEIPNKALTDDAPVYNRPVGVWKAPVPRDPPAWVLEELKKPRDYTADLKKLLASANICDKRWVFEQYDSMVQTNTVQGPGGEAGVIRIKGPVSNTGPTASGHIEQPDLRHDSKPQRGIAMALAGNGRWCYLDPNLGAMHAVAEAARKVACTGATPVAATNCLNFGNPEKPEIMAQLSAAIDGIAEACTALGTPITGGNVSLYNETKGEGIYPTPVIGVVGLLEDVSKAVPSSFQHVGDDVLLMIFAKHTSEENDRYNGISELGSSEFAKTCIGSTWGVPPSMSLKDESNLQRCLIELSTERLLSSACDASDGGIFVALAKAALGRSVGFEQAYVENRPSSDFPADAYWREEASTVVISCRPENTARVLAIAEKWEADRGAYKIGVTVEERFTVEPFFRTTVRELHTVYSSTLESQLGAEVVTG
ncbi:MAG TPA: phosphoribosylformylglycinamidine synthase subunit PurL [Acidobacteriaceae bacterium]|jgi:phosphoribosylformylglycinamidine synthase|nr:phosphoribosylformylglycinamidine synthase subunit PurL [Acidobacteriaceae bacterium]